MRANVDAMNVESWLREVELHLGDLGDLPPADLQRQSQGCPQRCHFAVHVRGSCSRPSAERAGRHGGRGLHDLPGAPGRCWDTAPVRSSKLSAVDSSAQVASFVKGLDGLMARSYKGTLAVQPDDSKDTAVTGTRASWARIGPTVGCDPPNHGSG